MQILNESFEVVCGDRHAGRFPLPATINLNIPPLCVGSIKHGLYLEQAYSSDAQPPCIVIAYKDVIRTRSLLVISKLIDYGEIITEVLNISNLEVKIRRGDIVSVLLSIKH